MQSLAKLAGIQEASTARTSSPARVQKPGDVEAQTILGPPSRASRSSLPSGQRNSRKSLQSLPSLSSVGNTDRTTTNIPPVPDRSTAHNSLASADVLAGQGDEPEPDEEEQDAKWDASHPCYPHPNPYVPLNSPEYSTTRIIRIKRTWLTAGDLYPVLDVLYPEILDTHIDYTDFRSTVEQLNFMLKRTFDPSSQRSILDALAGFFTGWIWDDLGKTAVKAGSTEIESWIDGWNAQKRSQGSNVRLISLRKSGYMSLDIQIPDPGLDDLD